MVLQITDTLSLIASLTWSLWGWSQLRVPMRRP